MMAWMRGALSLDRREEVEMGGGERLTKQAINKNATSFTEVKIVEEAA